MNARADDGTPYSEFPEREEDTHSGVPLTSMAPLPDDSDEALGVIYGAVARQGRHLEALKRQSGVITSEVTGLRKDFAEFRGDLNKERTSLVSHAARRSSNRMAVLMGGLFTAYEFVSPYLHELWRLLQHK